MPISQKTYPLFITVYHEDVLQWQNVCNECGQQHEFGLVYLVALRLVNSLGHLKGGDSDRI